MPNKYVIITALVLLAGAYAFGRYSAPVKIKTEVVTVEKVVKEQVVHTVTKIETHKDGTKETIITRDSDTNTHEDIKLDNKTLTVYSRPDLNISILAGLQPHMFQGVSAGPVVYGASVTKSLIGPITIGAWALSDLTVGASLGFNF